MNTKRVARCWLLVDGSKHLVLAFFVLVILFFEAQELAAQASFPPININLQYPQFQRLKLDGGYVYVNEGGMSGIILYRESETNYIAYERRCSVEDDAPVIVDGSGLFMKGCDSTFSFSDGYPTSGSVRNPLLKYRVSLDGIKLIITDEIVY
ncbi:MAG: hypothetical protein ACKO13_15255 [Cytophagales bacterium]